ncbi:hypothetical protein Nanz197_93 [Mycobacterium phage Nanz197]|nr:hypothetical protein Nanz197_93 [Mycobacterium phage Nanz197]
MAITHHGDALDHMVGGVFVSVLTCIQSTGYCMYTNSASAPGD